MEKFVLDTNLFFNMEPGMGLGKKTEDVLNIVTTAVKKAREHKKAEFFMPPRVVEEFLGFFEDKSQPVVKNFLAQITTKSPDISKIQLPASIFYKLIDDIRLRSYRGMNVAEEELKKAAKLPPEDSKKEFEVKTGPVIKSLRERYRQATRVGFLDSLADLDLIILAKELDATLVTTDEGVVAWGRVFGVREMKANLLGKWLQQI